MNDKSCEKLELNKVLACCAEHAVLGGTKEILLSFEPSSDLAVVRERLARTSEAEKLLFKYGVSDVEFFDSVTDLVVRAKKGSVLSCGELMQVNLLNRSARIAYSSVTVAQAEEIPLTLTQINKIYFDRTLEDDISTKIVSDTELSDFASAKLYEIRTKIKSLNARIRAKLSEYLSGDTAKYLQDNSVTIRNDRFVIPVRAEYKSKVRGLVHDRSQTGATFFIEPEYVLELNNELIALNIDEKEEVERILKSLSSRVGANCDKFIADEQILFDIDSFYARAHYAYTTKSTNPRVNGKGYINIIKGRHPLIDKNIIVPVSVELGKDYNFLLLSGANTGGKTVTLKMVGLFCLMAACGLFIPAAECSDVAVFNHIFCDLGDSQSIEESLSTFSSHVKNLIEIVSGVTSDSLVLIDELGGGTNPDEGQALARAITEHLLSSGCKGIITTHFTPLKEFAYSAEGIENASMEFDSATLKPLYSIKIGMPGASNAFAICRRMGLDERILDNAVNYLSEGGRTFENIVRRAEDSRVYADSVAAENEKLREELKQKVEEADKKSKLLDREREKLFANAKAESRRIINERSAEAEELLGEIEQIFSKEVVYESDLIKARTLKNKIKEVAFREEQSNAEPEQYVKADAKTLKIGAKVYVTKMQTDGEVVSLSAAKGEAEVLCGSIKVRCKVSELLVINNAAKKVEPQVKVVRKLPVSTPILELNVIGLSVEEALAELENFIDRAVTDNLEEVKVIHGVGTGKLRSAIAQRLKSHKNVASYRLGVYGEGETGVTFIKLK
ncbi:MAG: endonuclease MutS2 [Clostridia bacterium]|nr:endonuclease MutS2 [Clostridia bacterium]